MDTTITYLTSSLDTAATRSWNLLVCAIGAELEAFKQGKDLLEETLFLVNAKGKEKTSNTLVDAESSAPEGEEEEVSRSAIRITRSPPKVSVPPPKPSFFEDENDDPDPELMISHQDTDTD
jgi:hypothetical protein